jgi:hypothetical protein
MDQVNAFTGMNVDGDDEGGGTVTGMSGRTERVFNFGRES